MPFWPKKRAASASTGVRLHDLALLVTMHTVHRSDWAYVCQVLLRRDLHPVPCQLDSQQLWLWTRFTADNPAAALQTAGQIAAEVASQPRVERTLTVLDLEHWHCRTGEGIPVVHATASLWCSVGLSQCRYVPSQPACGCRWDREFWQACRPCQLSECR